ncbi:MAG: DUF2807 domain-containing protein [Legionella sp.]|uniref:GIN domain-containing protein n=1 Tax=Legionella sp. TaxID=459 RepID=UPI0039E29409
MRKWCCSLILVIIFLASCAHYGAKKPSVSADSLPVKRVTQYKRLSSFSQVEVQGRINVTLHTGYRRPQVVLRGDPRDLQQLKVVVSQNTFYLTLGDGFPRHGTIHADIQGQSLYRFSYKGLGTINGGRLHSNSLELYIENNGTTRLSGAINLRRLTLVGSGLTEINGINSQNLQLYFQGNPKLQLNGVANITNLMVNGDVWFSFYWLKSDTLTIRAKKRARIQLAGTVNRLDVELWEYAHFKGRYLRALRSFVKTHGHSVAEISSVNHQSTLATGASDIYYYNLPTTREDFMAYDGSVLDMREWDRIHLRDFDRYNKQFP